MTNVDPESVSWLRFAFASVTVVGLMALLAWGLKSLSIHGLGRKNGKALKLKIAATLPLDARRRLVIAQCDKTEYHLLLGPNNDLLLASHPLPVPEQSDTKPCP